MRIFFASALAVTVMFAAAPAAAVDGASGATSAFCTIHLGTVSAGGRDVQLPSVTYPCP